MSRCPTPEQLTRLLNEALNDEEHPAIEGHLERCTRCQETLEELTQQAKVVPASRPAQAADERAFLAGLVRQLAPARVRLAADTAPASQEVTPGGTAPAWPEVSGYEILGILGRGGVAVVYKARHRRLGRLVALKMLAGRGSDDPELLVRFRAEAEAVARLQHPNIVQIYEVGEAQGWPYLALEYVAGGSLRERLNGTPQPPPEAARLIETLARAIHVAHECGIVHRDLKPANILLVSGGVVSGGRGKGEADAAPRTTHHSPLTLPKITDFGLAKCLDVASGDACNGPATASGVIVGSPGYLAPEQATPSSPAAGEGKGVGIGPAADVYALGAILYELLTGRPPFRGETAVETVLQTLIQDLVPPRRLVPKVPRDLETICLKCLEKEPQRRYASAALLADDLGRFGRGEPIRARRLGLLARLARWGRRKPLIAALLFLLAGTFLLGVAGVTWQWLVARQQRELADDNARRADTEKAAALRQAYQARLAAATAGLREHLVAEAARQLAAAPVGLRGWEWRHLHSRLDDSLAVVPGLSEYPAAVVYNSAGCWVASCRKTVPNDEARLHDVLSGQQLAHWPEDDYGWVFAVPPPHRWLYARDVPGNPRRLLLVGDDQAVQRTFVVPPKTGVRALALSPDGTQLAVAWGDPYGPGWLGLLERTSGETRCALVGHTAPIMYLTFSPDGARLASAAQDRTVRLWNTASGVETAVLPAREDWLQSLAFSPDGTRLLTASKSRTMRQWDVCTGQPLDNPRGHSQVVLFAVYSPDGQRIASGGLDGTVRLWHAAGGEETAVFAGHGAGVVQLAFSPDGRQLVSAGLDNTARLWDVSISPDEAGVLRGHRSYVYPVIYSPDGSWLASGGWDDTIRLWDPATREAIAAWPAQHTNVLTLGVSPDGTRLFSGGLDGKIRIWSTATGQLQAAWRAHEQRVHRLAVSPDGTRVASWSFEDKSVRIWDAVTGREWQRLIDLKCAWFWGEIGYSPDGRLLATPGTDPNQVVLRDAATLRALTVLQGHTGGIAAFAFRADSKQLVTASLDKTVRIWDTATGTALGVLSGHTDEVLTAVFSPDGTRIASGGRDRMLRLWDAATQEEVIHFSGHSQYLYSLTFHPDGTTLASGSGDFTIRLWDTVPLARRLEARREAAALRPEAEQLVTRLFTELGEAEQVVARLRADSSLNEGLRRAARQAVLRRD